MNGSHPDAPRASDVAFTDGARRLLAGARAEAERLRHEYVGTEHLVLAMTRDAGASALFRRFGLDGEAVRAALEAIVGPGRSTLPPGAERPHTSRTRQAFGLAAESAAACGHAAVDIEHLVVGLLGERANIGAQVLQHHGLSVEQAAAAARRSGEGGRAETP